MRIDRISDNSTVYLDANIFLYHYEDISPDCSSLLERVERGKIKAVTSTRILDEVLHRRLIAEAISLYGWSIKQVVKRLRQNPEKLTKIGKHWEDVEELLTIGIEVFTLSLEDLLMARRIQKQFGLLVCDSLTVYLMEKHKIKILATRDEDFIRVESIDVWMPRIKGVHSVG